MTRRSRYDAAYNRVCIGTAPKFGAEGAFALAEENVNRWWRWSAHPSLGRVVRRTRPKERG